MNKFLTILWSFVFFSVIVFQDTKTVFTKIEIFCYRYTQIHPDLLFVVYLREKEADVLVKQLKVF